MTFFKAQSILKGRDSRKVGNNTYVQKRGDAAIALRLHNTDIITAHRDGRIVLKTGGWHSVTTKSRLNEYLTGVTIFQKNYGWFVVDNTQNVTAFYDGITVQNDRVQPKPF